MNPAVLTKARRVAAQQEARDVLAAAQGLIQMRRYDHNLRRFARASEVERECYVLLDFLELADRVSRDGAPR